MTNDNLKEYDDNFQAKLLASFITDKFFFQQTMDVVDPKHFTTEMDQFVVKLLFDYFSTYKQLPTGTVIKTEINKVKDDVFRSSIYDRLKKIQSAIDSTDLPYVKEEYLKFCLTKEIEQALMKSADLLAVGEVSGIQSLINKAFNSVSDRDLGYDYLKGFEERYDKNIRKPVPTPWPVINKLMDGGLSGGELGCIVGNSGRGKCVGPNTKIDIEYEEIGIEVNGNSGNKIVFWIKPWDKFNIDDRILFGWQISLMIKVIYRTKKQSIKVIDLFNYLEVPNQENAIADPEYDIKIKTPYGYKKIIKYVRTKKQKSITCYFSNNRTLKCSPDHRLKVNGDWTYVSDINYNTDIIETDLGITYLKYIKEHKQEILYDFAVEDVYCFYSNGVLSHNTWLLSAIGAHALRIGKNVIHYTLEINEHYVGKRYDSIYSGVPFSELRFKKEEVFDSIKNFDESTIVIKKYGGKKASIQTLTAHIEKCINNGIKPDLLIVDYADLLKPTIYHNKESHAILQDIYVDLCALAEEYNVPLWTVSQANRSSLNSDVMEEDSIAGSYGKVMESYFVMTLSRDVDDKQGGTAKIFVAKNRFGPDGLTFPSKFNASNGRILIYEKDSVEGKKVSKDLEEDITTRTELRDRYNELMNKTEKSDDEKIDLG